MNLTDLSLKEISGLLERREVASMELLDSYLKIALKGCCITFCNDLALQTVTELDGRRRFVGMLSPIEGIPFSLKDNISTEGILTTCNSRSLKSNVPKRNAAITENLLGSGAVLTAKNCMREFSVGRIDDSAFELRNYLVWAGTDKNINIGAFSVGTDLGLNDYNYGLWTLRPAPDEKQSSLSGVITGSPTLERITYSVRKADDLKFLYPYFACKARQDTAGGEGAFNPARHKVLIADSDGMSGHIERLFEENGFTVQTGEIPFLSKAALVYDCILSIEFFKELKEIGLPETSDRNGLFFGEVFLLNRAEGFGFEVKKLILSGAFLLSSENRERTLKLIDWGRNIFVGGVMTDYLKQYDFIVYPAIYGDNLGKASAVAGLSELTVPFADALHFKVAAKTEDESLLLSLASFLEERL